jgi:putative ABC transport system permease protein
MALESTNNRSMFWRIVRRLVFAHRGRLFVILLALGSGATITAALLNLQLDAKRRLTSEFRAFGANVVVASPNPNSTDARAFLNQSVADRVISSQAGGVTVPYAVHIYGIVEASVDLRDGQERSHQGLEAILAGGYHSDDHAAQIVPPALVAAERNSQLVDALPCYVGQRVAAALQMGSAAPLVLGSGKKSVGCSAVRLPSTGGSADDQIFIDLPSAQYLLGQANRVSLIELSVPGTPSEVLHYVDFLRGRVREADVRPVRQFTEAQARIYSRISGLLQFTVALVLILTALCVMAAMANVAMERRHDVGLMKAIGGARRRVLRFFLSEAVLLGLAGGVIGAALGIALSIFLGKAVFGLAARPRLIVYPVTVVLTVVVAILSAYPLRHLAGVRPASVFRGEA